MNKQSSALVCRESRESGMVQLLARMFKRASVGVAVLVTILPLLAAAQNSIQAISGSVQGGSEVIRIDLAEPLTVVPTGFSMQTPARFALGESAFCQRGSGE